MVTSEVLKEKQRQRVAFLEKLYELSGGNSDNFVNGGEVAAQIGMENWQEDQLRSVARYLHDEGLIKAHWILRGLPGHIQITHQGIREIEAALSQPDKPTQHFMPINILNVNNMVGSTVQQGAVASQQTVSLSNNFAGDLDAFLKELKASLPELPLDASQLQELKADVAATESQLGSPRPKTSILTESLRSIQRILESATGSALGAQLAVKVPALLALM